MDNPETSATLGTRDTRRRQTNQTTQHKKIKSWATWTPAKKNEDEGWAVVKQIRVITKLPNYEQSNKGKVKTHKYINRQNQSTTGKLWKP